MAKYDIHIMESLLGVLVNRGKWHLFQGNREHRSNFKWNWVQRQYWGTWNIRKQFSMLVEQENKPIYFLGTRGWLSPYEGLISVPIFEQTTSLFVCSSVYQHVILNCISEALTAVNVKTCILIVLCISNIHCNLWPHTMINITFAVGYAAEAYSSSTHYAIIACFIDFYDSVKRMYVFYEIRKKFNLHLRITRQWPWLFYELKCMACPAVIN